MMNGINPTALAMNAGVMQEYGDFAKAVATTSYTQNPLSRQNESALQPESLNPILRKVVETDQEMKLFKNLAVKPAEQVIHYWDVETDIGGQPGSVFQGEIDSIPDSNSVVRKYAILLKIAARRRVMSKVLKSVKSIVDLQALYRKDMVTEIVRGHNIAGYIGNDAVSPMQPNGIERQLALNAPNMILNMDGESDINKVTKAVFQKVRDVRGLGSFGRTSHLHIDLDLQNEFDANLFPSYRVALANNPSSIEYGTPVTAIKTSFGTVEMENDVYIESFSNTQLKTLTSVPQGAPGAAVITVTPVAAGVVNSKVYANRAGQFYVTVESIDQNFLHGASSNKVAATVAATGALDIAITPNADGKAYGFALYFSVKNPAAAPTNADYRLALRIPAADQNNRTAVTTYRFFFDDIPGSSKIYGLNRTEDAIGFLQLMPVSEVPLAAVDSAVVPFAVIYVGATVLWKPTNHFVIKNVLLAGATWKPFG